MLVRLASGIAHGVGDLLNRPIAGIFSAFVGVHSFVVAVAPPPTISVVKAWGPIVVWLAVLAFQGLRRMVKSARLASVDEQHASQRANLQLARETLEEVARMKGREASLFAALRVAYQRHPAARPLIDATLPDDLLADVRPTPPPDPADPPAVESPQGRSPTGGQPSQPGSGASHGCDAPGVPLPEVRS